MIIAMIASNIVRVVVVELLERRDMGRRAARAADPTRCIAQGGIEL